MTVELGMDDKMSSIPNITKTLHYCITNIMIINNFRHGLDDIDRGLLQDAGFSQTKHGNVGFISMMMYVVVPNTCSCVYVGSGVQVHGYVHIHRGSKIRFILHLSRT